MRSLVALGIALCVALAGCSALGPPAEPTATDGPTTATGTEPTTTTTTHPLAGDTVVVGVENGTPGPRSFVPLLRAAADRWNGTAVAGGTVRFRVDPDADAPDVTVTIPPRIGECGGRTTNASFYFCAPVTGPGDPAPATVSVAGRYDDATFRLVATAAFASLAGRPPERVDGYPPSADEVRFHDPWPASDPVVVNVSTPANESRSLAPLVREAVEWWADRPSTDRDYPVRFVVRPDAERADVHVTLVEEIDACGVEDVDRFVGCTDLLSQRRLAANDTTVRIEAGYTDASTLATLKHEFGHLYGREHGESPTDVMRAAGKATPWPRPNATDRPLGWADPTLSVYVDAGPDVDPDAAWADLQPAFDYYEQGADGWLDAWPRFERADSGADADVVIRVTTEPVCGFERGGVCEIAVDGRNTDGDPAYEYYTGERFTITTTGRTARSWMAAFALAYVLGAENQSEMPAPLRDAENANEQWWR